MAELADGRPAGFVGKHLCRAGAEDGVAAAFQPGKAPHFKARPDGGVAVALLVEFDVVPRFRKAFGDEVAFAQPEGTAEDEEDGDADGDAARAEVATAQGEDGEDGECPGQCGEAAARL